MKFHPLADIFPLLAGAELQALADDIHRNGQREPIVVYRKQILDGRNRWMACRLAKVEPVLEEFDGDDRRALAYVISANLRRRQMSESQRAFTAAQLATLPAHRPKGGKFASLTLEEAGTLFNVSERLIKYAREVRDRSHAGLIHAVEQDMIAVSAAAKLCTKDDAFIDLVIGKIATGAAPTEAVRIVRDAQLREAPPLVGKYRVFYADPPWSYGNTQPDYQTEQRDYYPVMSIAEICAVPVKAAALDDAVLFLWVTSPILRESFEVMSAWGFDYRASFVWDKVRHNMGHYNSVRHELLLIGVRGSCQPEQRQLFDSVQSIEATEHSRKPQEFYEIIETLYPLNDPAFHLEVFLRGEPREGWHGWGKESIDARAA